jgi:hypothetical protein
MNPENENRRENRFGCEAEVEWTYFNRPEGVEGRLLNFSGDGGCIESAQEVTARCTLLVRLKRSAAGSGKATGREGLRSAGLADVRWCRAIAGKKAPRYAIGLKYVKWY